MKLPYLVAAACFASLPSFAEDGPLQPLENVSAVVVQVPLENIETNKPIELTYYKKGDHLFPDFAFTDINPQSASYQQSISLDSLLEHHKPIVVNFWHYSCFPCLAEMPDLERVHQSGNAIIVGLSEGASQVFSPELRNSNIPASVFENAEKVLASITYPILGSAAEDPQTKSFYRSLPYHEITTIPEGTFPIYAIPLSIILRPNAMVDGYYIGADHTMYEKLSGVLEKIK